MFKHFNCVITDGSFSNISFFFFLCQDVGCRKWIGKWSEISVLNISFKISIYKFIGIWSIIVEVLFITGITMFWWIKFKQFCTFLLRLWSNKIEISCNINILLEFFVFKKKFLKKCSKCLKWPLGGLWRTLTIALLEIKFLVQVENLQ